MRQFSILLITITLVGLLTTGCGSNNTAPSTNDKDSV